jgi:hypothetical protein
VYVLERTLLSQVVILFRINLITALFIDCAKSMFGGSSVQRSVPSVDPTSDTGQVYLLSFTIHLLGINVLWF